MRPTFLLCLFMLALSPIDAHADPTGHVEDPDVATLDDFDASADDVTDSSDLEISAAPSDGLACAYHATELDQLSLLDVLTHADLREPVTGYVYASDFETYGHASGYPDEAMEGDAVV